MKTLPKTIAGMALFMVLFSAGSASALSVQWSTSPKQPAGADYSSFILSDRSYGQGAWGTYVDGWSYGLVRNPSITITYGAKVTNTQTGAIVACGSSVPVGTRLKFSFDSHDYSDIYWFASGGSFDSPYGEWVNGAGRPDSDMCTYLPAKDYVDTYDSRQPAAGSPADITGKIYSTLSVDPPNKTLPITGGVNCSGDNNSLSRVCTATAAGAISAKFQFSSTIGKFYGRTKVIRGSSLIPTNSCYTSNRAMQHIIRRTADKSDYVFEGYSLQVPTRTISCAINVTSAASQTLSGSGSSAGSNDSCVVGNSYTINLDSAPAANTQIRYLVDWNADGNVDQIVPSSGYVDAGTNLTASRTFAVAGSKTVKVRVEDTAGNLSEPVTITFACTNTEDANVDTNNTDDGFSDGSFGSGDNSDGTTGVTPAPVISLRVVPSLVARGDKSKVFWSATYVDSCTVTGSNGDSWQGDNSPVGGQETSAIQDRTDFTLSCDGEDGSHPTRTVTVSILPNWEEQ